MNSFYLFMNGGVWCLEPVTMHHQQHAAVKKTCMIKGLLYLAEFASLLANVVSFHKLMLISLCKLVLRTV